MGSIDAVRAELRWPWVLGSAFLLGAGAVLFAAFRPTEPFSIALLVGLIVLAVAMGLRRISIAKVQASFGVWMFAVATGSYLAGDTVDAIVAVVAALAMLLAAATESQSGE